MLTNIMKMKMALMMCKTPMSNNDNNVISMHICVWTENKSTYKTILPLEGEILTLPPNFSNFPTLHLS